MKRWQHLIWKSIAGAIAALVILSALLVGVFRMLAPLVPGYRLQVQTLASRILDRPVRIAAIGAQWGLYGPEITLEDVQLLSRDRQRVVVKAREIRMGYTPGAILRGHFARPNRIILIHPQLILERTASGALNLHGLEPARVSTNWRQVAAEVFAQDAQVLVRSGEITLRDLHSAAAPLVFSDIRVNLDNSAEDHTVIGRLILPAALGRSLSFSGRIQGQGIQPQNWRWQTEVQGEALNLPHLFSYWPEFSGRLSSGLVDGRAAVSGVGTRIEHLLTDIYARQLVPENQATSSGGFGLLSAIVNWQRNSSGWDLKASNIRMQRGQDVWPATSVNVQYSRGANGMVSWSGNAGFLRLQDLVVLASWLPPGLLPENERLQRLAPTGDINRLNFQARWKGNVLDQWTLSGHFAELGLHADGKVPGFTGLNGALSIDQDQGSLQLASRQATALFPGLFRGPLTATALSAQVQFRHDNQGWHISTQDFSAANADVKAQAQGTFLLPADGGSPVIDLHAQAQDVNAASKSTYLPVGIMPKPVVAWLDDAIRSGRVPSGSLVLRGKLRDFPYDNGTGLFDIRFHLLDGTLDYASGWPAIKHLDAEVEFKNQGLEVEVRHATLLDDDISGTVARFRDLRNGILEIKGTARGNAATALEFLRVGPLKQRFGDYPDTLKAGGRSDISLNLVLPVKQIAQFSLEGTARLKDVSLSAGRLPEWTLSHLNGELKISRKGVSSEALSGRFLGQPITISLHPNPGQDSTSLTLDGGAQAPILSAALPTAYQKAFSGVTSWQLTGELPNNPVQNGDVLSLNLTSDLRGFGIDLPAPFDKTAAATVPLQANLKFTAGHEMLVQARYGDQMSGIYRFDDQTAGWRLNRGELVLGTGQPSLPDRPGLKLTGNLPEFSLEAWKSYVLGSGSLAGKLLPEFLLGVNVHVQHFTGFGQIIEALHVQVQRESSVWKLSLASTDLNGQISIPYQVDDVHPIIAAMQNVKWVHKRAKVSRTQNPSPFKPTDIPPLRISVKRLRFNDMTLDNVHAVLDRQPDGVSLKTLSIDNPAFTLNSSGQWVQNSDGTQQSSLEVGLKSRDLEKTLQSFGYAPAITGDQGELKASLHWAGSPFSDILPILYGKLHVRLDDGHLLEVKPGAGRLFGLLSINALPRRLLLNFSDVLGKGFGYDSIQGDFTIESGDAYTSDLVVSGPAAKIHVIGRTGLVKHDFDEALIVDTSVGSSLPVLGALAASSVGVGAVLFILTEIFKKPLAAVGEMRYRLTGTWDNPVLTEVGEAKPAANERH